MGVRAKSLQKKFVIGFYIKTYKGHISGEWTVYRIIEDFKAWVDTNLIQIVKTGFYKIKWFFSQNTGWFSK